MRIFEIASTTKQGIFDMAEYRMRLLEHSEQKIILPLLGICFPDYWEQIAVKTGRMPFEEISFAAFDGTEPIAHCGIIPYEIKCNDRICKMAGIASVATLPEYRNQGLAAKLCKMAVKWAKSNCFTSLPLYTGHFRVYESNHWEIFDTPPVRQIVSGKKTAALSWCKGSDLSDTEKNNIIRLYEASDDFNGKVIRQKSGTLHSWERIFNEPDFRFAAVPRMYAVKIDDCIIELNFNIPNTSAADRKRLFYQLGARNIFLPETPVHQELFDGVDFENSSVDVMHGEKVMTLDIVPNFHKQHRIFFPIVDKF